MNKTIGFVALSIENDQQSKFILDTINRLSIAAPFLDHILFNSYYFSNITSFNSFATLHINEAKYFKGPIICFTLKDMIFLSDCISKQKIFICNNNEWTHSITNQPTDYLTMQLTRYNELYKYYVSSNDLLCTTSSVFKPLLDICWKSSVLLPESNPESIYEYIKL